MEPPPERFPGESRDPPIRLLSAATVDPGFSPGQRLRIVSLGHLVSCQEPPGRRHAPPEDRLHDKAISMQGSMTGLICLVPTTKAGRRPRSNTASWRRYDRSWIGLLCGGDGHSHSNWPRSDG